MQGKKKGQGERKMQGGQRGFVNEGRRGGEERGTVRGVGGRAGQDVAGRIKRDIMCVCGGLCG